MAVAVTRHAIPVFPIPVRIGNADLHVVEVQLHAAAGIVPAVPLHVNHTELAGEDSLDGMLGGVTSLATKATTTFDQSPNLSEYVGTALTRNS